MEWRLPCIVQTRLACSGRQRKSPSPVQPPPIPSWTSVVISAMRPAFAEWPLPEVFSLPMHFGPRTTANVGLEVETPSSSPSLSLSLSPLFGRFGTANDTNPVRLESQGSRGKHTVVAIPSSTGLPVLCILSIRRCGDIGLSPQTSQSNHRTV